MAYERVPTEKFVEAFGTLTELSSVALHGQIVSVSDEFFAEAENLIKVEPAASLKGQFGPNGALYSGWETRRHNSAYDWCIIKLGAPGSLYGFDIDTAHFNGNEAPEASVEGIFVTGTDAPSASDTKWTEILPRTHLGPNSRHLFRITSDKHVCNYVKLNIYPDGGIARFRAYGLVQPTMTKNPYELVDLADVFAGGRVVHVSDQHFGVGSNLVLPGRGVNMGDGWETKRSRSKGNKDSVTILLGDAGHLEQVEIDTNHFLGNYPEFCELHALRSNEVIPEASEELWTSILPRTPLGPGRRHFFQLENVQGKQFSHVRVTIYPDGGIKRVRILGRRESLDDQQVQINGTSAIPNNLVDRITTGMPNGILTPVSQNEDQESRCASPTKGSTSPALPLTPEAFAPFGQVIQAFADVNSAPKGIRVTKANQGSADKYHKMALLQSCYPEGSNATSGLSIYRCRPVQLPSDRKFAVKLLERHPYTNQSFIPMGSGAALSEDALQTAGRAYLVIVAKTAEDGKPDLQSLRAFVANSAQAIMYNTGVWHHPMISLETTMDFTCVETQIGDGGKADCEILELDGDEAVSLPQVYVPVF